MQYNWSWLPRQRATTPPPNTNRRVGSSGLDNVEVLEEAAGDPQQDPRSVFSRTFPHDNQENDGTNEFAPLDDFGAEDDMMNDSDLSTEIASDVDRNEDETDIDNGDEENVEDAEITGDEDPDTGMDEQGQEDEPPFDPASVGLKEISNLASFTVSSYKPGCGVKELRDDDIHLFWQ